jgi:hypothetical protein
MKPITKTAFFFISLLLLATSSTAIGSVPLAPRKNAAGKLDMFGCMQSNEFYIVNFASYQTDPQTSGGKQPGTSVYCQNLPAAGPAQFTVDLLDRDVRHKPVWIKVFNADKQPIFETPKVTAKQGVITANMNLPSSGVYDITVYVDDNDLNIAPEIGALHIALYAGISPPEPPTSGRPVIVFLIVIAAAVIILGWYLPRRLKTEAVTD